MRSATTLSYELPLKLPKEKVQLADWLFNF